MVNQTENKNDLLNIANYTTILKTFLTTNYLFIKYQDDINQLIALQKPFVLFRHDVDFSIRAAVEIAKLETQLGVTSTYFFHLRSPLYNVLSEYAVYAVNEIHSMGHDICLHFDMHFYGENFHIPLLAELDGFKRVYPFCNNKIVSFHRVGKNAFSLDSIQMPKGIMHTYQDIFFNLISYHSDSGGWWKRGSPIYSADFANNKPMQILTHPMWWTEAGHNRFEKLDSYLSNNREQTIDFLEETVISYALDSIRNQDK